jgi:hypothetical protein
MSGPYSHHRIRSSLLAASSGTLSHVDLFAVVVACISLALSSYAVLLSRRQVVAGEQLTRIEQERRTEEQQDREAAAEADLHARVTVALSGKHIVVGNDGPHEATDVHVVYLDPQDGLPPPITSRWSDIDAVLASATESKAPAGLTAQTSRRFTVALTWTDGAGQQRTQSVLRADPPGDPGRFLRVGR